MKKLMIITVFTILIAAPFTNLKAQYGIPSYNVSLSGSSITFEESHPVPPYSAPEERQLQVDATDDNRSSTAWINIEVYKLNGSSKTILYTVYESSPLVLNIDEDEWGVEIIAYSSGTSTSIWIEE